MRRAYLGQWARGDPCRPVGPIGPPHFWLFTQLEMRAYKKYMNMQNPPLLVQLEMSPLYTPPIGPLERRLARELCPKRGTQGLGFRVARELCPKRGTQGTRRCDWRSSLVHRPAPWKAKFRAGAKALQGPLKRCNPEPWALDSKPYFPSLGP